MSDLHASAAYRRRVAVALGIRALEQARADAARQIRRARDESRSAHQRRSAHRRCRAAQDAARCAAREFPAQRRPCRLRARRLRRLHRAARWRAGALLPDVRGAGRRLRDHHHRRAFAGAGRTQRDAGRVLRNPRPAMRLLHAGHDPRRACAAAHNAARRRARISSRRSRAISAAAPATARSSKRCSSPPIAAQGQYAASQHRHERAEHDAPAKACSRPRS